MINHFSAWNSTTFDITEAWNTTGPLAKSTMKELML